MGMKKLLEKHLNNFLMKELKVKIFLLQQKFKLEKNIPLLKN